MSSVDEVFEFEVKSNLIALNSIFYQQMYIKHIRICAGIGIEKIDFVLEIYVFLFHPNTFWNNVKKCEKYVKSYSYF